jgi:hypothetical protein
VVWIELKLSSIVSRKCNKMQAESRLADSPSQGELLSAESVDKDYLNDTGINRPLILT